MSGVGLLALTMVVAGCESPAKSLPRVPAYPTARIESELVRGVSTRADVERVLGRPNGAGGLLFPGLPEARDSWFYQQTRLATNKGADGRMHFETQMDIVLIFFRDDRFDGFMWFSDADGTW